MRVARPKPWEVDDELWAVIEPLLPKVERRARNPGRKRHPDRLVFQGILFVLHTGIAWEHLPQELGFGSGMTCWLAWRSGPRLG
ncbi:transposase [Streptomyces sp. NPDC090112]|uniref:transposase n=1 Tax=Streptomyces sp. NPDC090112 TaxID=3365949 RepID=UPI0038070283